MSGIFGNIPTGTASMRFNTGNQRVNTAGIMNYTNRKIDALSIRTDSIRLSSVSNTGIEQEVQPISGSNWTNVFTIGAGVEPTVTLFNPRTSTNWDSVVANAPVYNGESHICSVYGHVVLKEADGTDSPCVLNLGVFINDKLVGEVASSPDVSPLMGVAIPDVSDPSNKATTDITVNVVVSVTKGDTITLKIRHEPIAPTGNVAIPFKYYQANLFCRPVELNGTDKYLNPV